MKRNKTITVIVLIVALIATGAFRYLATETRDNAADHRLANSTNLSRMNSFALALLLGGLRGPLVMALWTSSESQKSERNLDDFDTKVEWIRLLQPEFDSVHIFQVWNKAYNISVQMASIANKYATILDAIEYARRVDAERPNNINVISALAQVYGEKLGNSQEAPYYTARVRTESMPPEASQKLEFPGGRLGDFYAAAQRVGVLTAEYSVRVRDDDAGGQTATVVIKKPIADLILPALGDDFPLERASFTPRAIDRSDPNARPLELEPLLDENFMIRDSLRTATRARPDHVGPDDDWNNGAELQYLTQYEPYPYGVSPLAIGYNYHKEAQVLRDVDGQKHAQLSNLVIDSRPALALKKWSEQEWKRGRKGELAAFGSPIPGDRLQMEVPTVELKLDASIENRAAYELAIHSYDLSRRLGEDAIEEYEAHIAEFTTNFRTYTSHMTELRGRDGLLRGDAGFLRAIDTTGDERQRYIASAIEGYEEAIRRFRIMIVGFYATGDQVSRLFPEGVGKEDAADLDDERLRELADAILRDNASNPAFAAAGEETAEFLLYIDRSQIRIETLRSARASAGETTRTTASSAGGSGR